MVFTSTISKLYPSYLYLKQHEGCTYIEASYIVGSRIIAAKSHKRLVLSTLHKETITVGLEILFSDNKRH